MPATVLSGDVFYVLPTLEPGSIDCVMTSACKYHRLRELAGEMWATIKLNFERGYLVAANDDCKLNLAKIIANWERQIADLGESS